MRLMGVRMTNLSEFLENWVVDTQIIVESGEKEIFRGKAGDLSDDESCRYWMQECSAKVVNGEIHIPVKHENEVNRKLEEQNNISFSAIWENMQQESKLNEEIKTHFDSMLKAANRYAHDRKKRDVNDDGHSLNYDSFLSALDSLAELVEKTTGHKVAWRVVLGDDRHQIEEYAEYMIGVVAETHKRVEILEAIIWAQEHQNELYSLFDHSSDGEDAKWQLMLQYKFNENQACAIKDMRIRTFCRKEKEKFQKELNAFREREGLYPDL